MNEFSKEELVAFLESAKAAAAEQVAEALASEDPGAKEYGGRLMRMFDEVIRRVSVS
jgi:hypothetical protein